MARAHPDLAPRVSSPAPAGLRPHPPLDSAPVDGAARGAARGGLANIVGAGFAGFTGVLVTWLVARGLGPAPAGAFFAATAMFVLVGGVAKLGTQTGLVYWLARLRATGRTDLLGACLRTALVPVTALGVVLGAAMWWGAPALARLSAGDDGRVLADHVAGLRTLAVFVPVAALTDALLTATRGYRVMRPTVMLDKIVRSALQLAGVGGLAVATLWTGTALPAYALAWAAPYLPVTLLAAVALRRIYRTTRDRSAAGHHSTRDRVDRDRLRRDFWRFTGPRAVASVAQLAVQRVDVLMVAALGGLTSAAIYAVAGRFVVLVQFANQGISQSVQPRLAEALSTGDVRAANRLYQVATGWLVLAAWPVILLVITYAPVYLAVFGKGYRAGAGVVVVLAGAMLLATGCGMVDMVLAMAGRTSANLVNVLIALAVTVGVDLLTIPWWGALGAAAGLACAMTVNNLLPLWQVYRSAGLHPFGVGTVTAGGLAVACFGVLPWVVAAFAGTGPAGLAITLAVGVPGYLGGARLLRARLALDAFTRPGRAPTTTTHPRSRA